MSKESTSPALNVRWLPPVVFIVCLVVYLASPVITSCDSAFTVPTALSLIHEGNPDLNEYPEFLARHNPKAVEWIDGRAYSIFPVAISMAAVPFVWVAERVIPRLLAAFPAFERILRTTAAGFMDLPAGPLGALDLYPAIELVAAATYTALAVMVFLLLARRRLALSRAVALTLLFAFGTSMWSVASRALWQHGPAILMLLLAMLDLTRPGTPSPGRAGFFMALAFLIRPTFALPAAAGGLFLLASDRRAFLRYAGAAALPLLLFMAWNAQLHGEPLPPYFSVTRVLDGTQVGTALAGHLVSPARGLFIYSPFLLLALPRLFAALKTLDIRRLDFYLAGAVLLHVLVISSFPHWWGGYSIGPRLMSDVLPVLFWFLIPVVADFCPPLRRRQKSLAVLAGLTCLWSVALHAHASTSFAVYLWNAQPVSVDQAPGRLWDWTDPPFLRFAAAPAARPEQE